MSGLMRKQRDCKFLRKNLEGIKLSSLLKIPAFFFRHKYLSILEIGENLENHDDGRMKKKLNFP